MTENEIASHIRIAFLEAESEEAYGYLQFFYGSDRKLPFADFDALLAGAAVFVGNDSGPKHLAALRGVPVVSIHSARINWNEWGQEQTGVIISRRVPCAGCGITEARECGRNIACIRDIRAEEVLAAVLPWIGQTA